MQKGNFAYNQWQQQMAIYLSCISTKKNGKKQKPYQEWSTVQKGNFDLFLFVRMWVWTAEYKSKGKGGQL